MKHVVNKYTICRLQDFHDIESFDCGEPARNKWLVERAISTESRDFSRTFVASDGSAVHGFYALTVASVVRTSLPSAFRRNTPDSIGCVLLAQLAVALTQQKRGLSTSLVLHAMWQASRIADVAGCPLLAVHPARPDVVEMYLKYGFVRIDTTPVLMVMPISKVRATLTAIADSN